MSITKPAISELEIWAKDAGATDKERPDQSNITDGWGYTQRPPAKYFNWILWLVSNFMAYINEKGIPEWDVSSQYVPNSIVMLNGNMYISSSINDGATPESNPTDWRSIGSKVGETKLMAGSGVPSGWRLCNGDLVLRSEYPDLFTEIGETWNAGDGSTTFGLPDPRGKAIIGSGTGASLTTRAVGDIGGAETHQLTTSELPSHNHTFNFEYSATESGGGKLPVTGVSSKLSTDYTGSDAAHNNMQPFACFNLIIYTGV